MKDEFRLPDGKITTSEKRYFKEWNAIKNALEKALDLKTIGFDPGFLMQSKGGGKSVDIPVWMAIRIVDLAKKSKSMAKFSGSRMDVGYQIFERVCLPLIHEASKNAPPNELAQMYMGFLSSVMGSMAADFGHQTALNGANAAVNSFARMADELEGSKVQ